MFPKSPWGHPLHGILCVAQLTVTDLTGDPKKSLRKITLLPFFTKPEEEIEFWKGSSLEKNLKQCLESLS